MIHAVVRDLADADVKKAQSWYARDDQRRGFQFVQDFSRTVERIGVLPDQFPEVGNGVRRALLHDFPYATYFVRRENVAIIIAVLHQRRRPGGWKPRAERERTG
jgi:plasmid stabilization system protein ParE